MDQIPIPVTGASASPIPIPSGFGLPGYASPKPGAASPSPPPNPRTGIEGVWEMVIQRATQPEYVHFNLKQTGTTLTGSYLDKAGKSYPLTGTVDGQHFRMIVTLPNGTSALMEGRLDGTSDMVGKLTTPTRGSIFHGILASERKMDREHQRIARRYGRTRRRRRRRGYPGGPP